MRGTSREYTGPRGSRARLAGATITIVVVAVAVTIYVITQRRPAPAPLPTQVLSSQPVGLVAMPAAGAAGTQALAASGPGLTFSAAAGASAQWTADRMAGNSYIFIYLASGRCLAAPARRRPPALARCDLAGSQRWRQQGQTAGPGGGAYWQLRNLGSGRCLAAGAAGGGAQLQPCQNPAGQAQLFTLATQPS